MKFHLHSIKGQTRIFNLCFDRWETGVCGGVFFITNEILTIITVVQEKNLDLCVTKLNNYAVLEEP